GGGAVGSGGQGPGGRVLVRAAQPRGRPGAAAGRRHASEHTGPVREHCALCGLPEWPQACCQGGTAERGRHQCPQLSREHTTSLLLHLWLRRNTGTVLGIQGSRPDYKE
ncbi:unnamed protein product, partial [Heterosigma akashiwo]